MGVEEFNFICKGRILQVAQLRMQPSRCYLPILFVAIVAIYSRSILATLEVHGLSYLYSYQINPCIWVPRLLPSSRVPVSI